MKRNDFMAVAGLGALLAWLGSGGVVVGANAPDGATSRATAGRELYVDSSSGDDRANGLAAKRAGGDGPVRTIARGIQLALAGDTVHLAPGCYHEYAQFHNRHGEPGRPITLDGQGATLECSDPLVPADWQQVAPGLYRNDHLLRPDLLTRDDAVIDRWFFLWDGRMNRMGRTAEGPRMPLKPPQDLMPGEWTIVKAEHAFYIRIDPSQTLSSQNIAAPTRGSAVILSGDCAHIVVRNIIGKHAFNDGYNIHGVTRDARFEHISAIECGDDGFSAHDDCQVGIDGFVSIGNSSGIANTGHSHSENRRVWIQDCPGIDVLIMDEGFHGRSPQESCRHSLVDSVIISSADRCLILDGSRGIADPCRLELDNVLIRRVRPAGEIRVTRNATLVANRVTILGARLLVADGAAEVRHSIIGGTPPPEITLSRAATWQADHNLYDLDALHLGASHYKADAFAAYRRASGQDADSRWGMLRLKDASPWVEAPGFGVDTLRLPSR